MTEFADVSAFVPASVAGAAVLLTLLVLVAGTALRPTGHARLAAIRVSRARPRRPGDDQ